MVDAAYKVFPQVTPCVFVDDIAADMHAACGEQVRSAITKSLLIICSRFTADGLEVSASKSVVTASTNKLSESIVANRSPFGIRFKEGRVLGGRVRRREPLKLVGPPVVAQGA